MLETGSDGWCQRGFEAGSRLFSDGCGLVVKDGPAEAQTRQVGPEQNGPAPLLLRHHWLIPMVQSAEDQRGDQLGGPDDRSIGLGLWNRRIAVEVAEAIRL